MIKKFNEDWHSHLDLDNSTSAENNDEFVVDATYSFIGAIQKAKKMALEQDKVIRTNFKSDGIVLYVDKYSDILKLQKEFLDKKDKILKKQKFGSTSTSSPSIDAPKLKKGDKILVPYLNDKKEGTIENIDRDSKGNFKYYVVIPLGSANLWHWFPEKDIEISKKIDKSSTSKFKIGDTVFDLLFKREAKIVDYDESRITDRQDPYRIEYDNGTKIWTGDESLKLINDAPKKEVTFQKGIEVVGLPSGQVIYMNQIQLQYFKARDVVQWVKVYKKPVSGGGRIPIPVDAYCFEDPLYSKIIDMMDTIVW